MSGTRNKKTRAVFILAAILPIVLLVLSLNIGAYRIPPKAVWTTIVGAF